jgi:hypothetical protein
MRNGLKTRCVAQENYLPDPCSQQRSEKRASLHRLNPG